ncbi:hypothetical protein WCP94_003650 [Bilophila wadsworthia]
MLSTKSPDARLSWFILKFQWDNKESLVVPKPLGFFKIETVLELVLGALVRIVFKFHVIMV